MIFSPKIGMVVSKRLATLHELRTIYGTQDLEGFVDVVLTDSHNAAAMARWAEKQRDKEP